MDRLIDWLQAFAQSIGGPGLFVIAFLDSSILSLPEINDLLVVAAVIEHPRLLPYYAAMSTAGSLLGCFLLYYIGRRGGETFLRRRFGDERLDRSLRIFRRYGLFAVLVPSLLPPPAPFKIFVLLAGVAGISRTSFGTAILIGRGVRYFGEGLLALWYGERAIAFLQEEGRTIALALAGLALATAIMVIVRRRRRQGADALTGDTTREL
jgi:membrane protein YqaA with SNARE-associated domain